MMLKAAPRASYEPQISLMIAELGREESRRDKCPVCEGGTSGEKSFSYSRSSSGVGYYICFRASCGVRGQVYGVGPGAEIGPPTKPIYYRFSRVLIPLNETQLSYFRDKFDINPNSDIMFCPEYGAYAHKIHGPLGEQRGWVLKTYENPKQTFVFQEQPGPWQSWHSPNNGITGLKTPNTVILVEDFLSARKVRDAGFDSVALLGVQMDFEKAYEIADWTNDIVLALDKGTMGLMIKYREKFSSLFNSVTIWSLEGDLKYITRERIRSGVLDGRSDFLSEP